MLRDLWTAAWARMQRRSLTRRCSGCREVLGDREGKDPSLCDDCSRFYADNPW